MISTGSKLEQLLSLAANSEDERYIKELHRLILRGMYLDQKESTLKDALIMCIDRLPVSKVSKYERALDEMPKNGPDPVIHAELKEELSQ